MKTLSHDQKVRLTFLLYKTGWMLQGASIMGTLASVTLLSYQKKYNQLVSCMQRMQDKVIEVAQDPTKSKENLFETVLEEMTFVNIVNRSHVS